MLKEGNFEKEDGWQKLEGVLPKLEQSILSSLEEYQEDKSFFISGSPFTLNISPGGQAEDDADKDVKKLMADVIHAMKE